MMWHWGAGWGWWMTFGMVLFWVFIAAVIWAVLRATRHERRPSVPSAAEILAERFARGELNAEEYKEARRVLLER